jgi:hypothetical protein
MASPLEDNLRTKMAHRFFEDCAHFHEGKIEVKGTIYEGISGEMEDFSSRPIASMGSSSTREVILLDPKQSRALHEKFDELVAVLTSASWEKGSSLSEEEIVDQVYQFVQERIFNRSPYELESFIRRQKASAETTKLRVGDVDVTCIPIDEFIKAGVGVCRHHALVTAYLLHRLTQGSAPLLSGIVQHMRTSVDGSAGSGAHVWATYVNASRRMHIDTLWRQFVVNVEDKPAQGKLRTLYGSRAIDYELARTAPTVDKARRIAELRLLERARKERAAIRSDMPEWIRPGSFRAQLFSQLNAFLKNAELSSKEYSHMVRALDESMLRAGTPIRSNLSIYMTKVHEELLKPFAGTPADSRPKGLQILCAGLHASMWNISYDETTDKIAWNKDHSRLIDDLHEVIRSVQSGTLNRAVFDRMPDLVKHAIFGNTYWIEQNAGRPTEGDFDFGRHAFYGEGRSVSNDTRIRAIQQYLLEVSTDLFRYGREEDAMKAFVQLDERFRNENIYGAMWEVCGKPLGDLFFGARAFHGEKSTCQGRVLRGKRIEALELAQKRLST